VRWSVFGILGRALWSFGGLSSTVVVVIMGMPLCSYEHFKDLSKKLGVVFAKTRLGNKATNEFA
jgi:hypothetical protein